MSSTDVIYWGIQDTLIVYVFVMCICMVVISRNLLSPRFVKKLIRARNCICREKPREKHLIRARIRAKPRARNMQTARGSAREKHANRARIRARETCKPRADPCAKPRARNLEKKKILYTFFLNILLMGHYLCQY